jgi:DNA invertase Pin-like site-specific DNA recombinase
MKIMYVRVSSKDQNPDIQLEAGKTAGVERFFEEKISGKDTNRPEFQKMLEHLRPGDTVIVYKLDRLARSTMDLLNTIQMFDAKGIGFKSISESWADTTTPAGRLMITIFAGLAEFERELIRERQMAGIAEAKRQGKHLGRPPRIDGDQKELIRVLSKGGKTPLQLSRMYKVSKTTIFRILKEEVNGA